MKTLSELYNEAEEIRTRINALMYVEDGYGLVEKNTDPKAIEEINELVPKLKAAEKAWIEKQDELEKVWNENPELFYNH